MVSFAYFITICLASIAVRSEDLSSTTKEAEVEPKWFGGGFNSWSNGFRYYTGSNLYQLSWWPSWSSYYPGCYGAGLLGGWYDNYYFAKASDTGALSRRAIALDADHLYPRGSGGAVSCANEKGAPSVFMTPHCVKAAHNLADKKVSSASCGTCRLSLVSSKDRVVPLNTPGLVLEKAARGLLEACSNSENAKQVRRSAPLEANEKQVVMLLTKGNGEAC